MVYTIICVYTYRVLTTQNLVSLHHGAVDPLHSVRTLPALSCLVTATLLEQKLHVCFCLVWLVCLLFAFYIPHQNEIVLYAVVFSTRIVTKALKVRGVRLFPFTIEEAMVLKRR